MINRRDAFRNLMAGGLGLSVAPKGAAGARRARTASPQVETLDMVHANPGEPAPDTRYLDPAFLARRRYSAIVIEHAIEGVPLLTAYDPTLIAPDSPEHRFAENLRQEIQAKIAAAKAQGLAAYAWIQYVVLPKRLLQKHGHKLVDRQGRLDVQLDETQRVLALLTAEIFSTFPQLDGLVVRTGEVYLHDLPYHDSRPDPTQGDDRLIQSATAITHGEQSHLALIRLLREEICVKAGRKLFYRTWDFGDNFHDNPKYYLGVTDRIEPHPLMAFSIKHQRGDFHRLVPFNPTLALGRHRQIVEVQAQLEGYGKGAHPYYVAQGVIEGWEEHEWIMRHCSVRGLKDILHDQRLCGVWTWSRGGGWGGPRIRDELWCDLNAFVVSGFARDPGRSEADLFDQYARDVLRLSAPDTARLRQACLLSAKAVLRGQLTTLGAAIDPWWARDDTLSEPDLGDFVGKGIVGECIAEKEAAVQLWQQIDELMRAIRFPDEATGRFARVSARYGLCKYSAIAAGWTAILLARSAPSTGRVDGPGLAAAVAAYDRAWDDWRRLAAEEPLCPSLPEPKARGGGPGLQAAIERCRALLA